MAPPEADLDQSIMPGNDSFYIHAFVYLVSSLVGFILRCDFTLRCIGSFVFETLRFLLSIGGFVLCCRDCNILYHHHELSNSCGQ